MDHIRFGETGESLAVEYLKKRGYQIMNRRYRTKTGEIDIIASDGDYIVFIEVKTRRSTYCGRPAEAVTWYKQRKIIRTAQWYLQQTSNLDCPCRFDVLEVLIVQPTAVEYNHIINAFCG